MQNNQISTQLGLVFRARRQIVPPGHHESVFANVFGRLASEWIGYRADVASYLVDGDEVVAFGAYAGTYKATGRSMRAAFAHHYALRGGKVVRMVQYVDSHMVRQAMTPARGGAGG